MFIGRQPKQLVDNNLSPTNTDKSLNEYDPILGDITN